MESVLLLELASGESPTQQRGLAYDRCIPSLLSHGSMQMTLVKSVFVMELACVLVCPVLVMIIVARMAGSACICIAA